MMGEILRKVFRFKNNNTTPYLVLPGKYKVATWATDVPVSALWAGPIQAEFIEGAKGLISIADSNLHNIAAINSLEEVEQRIDKFPHTITGDLKWDGCVHALHRTTNTSLWLTLNLRFERE